MPMISQLVLRQFIASFIISFTENTHLLAAAEGIFQPLDILRQFAVDTPSVGEQAYILAAQLLVHNDYYSSEQLHIPSTSVNILR
jgi:hypothetical protein